MIATRSKPAVSVLFVELNEAEKYFLDRLIAAGKLPTFARLVREGVYLRTRIPTWDAGVNKAWRDISPWIVWPSIYTGMTPQQHGIIGFGQDTASIRGRCIWDVLDSHGIPIGVFGSLMSYPPRTSGAARYYVPEGLADDADCFPPEARAAQEFNIFSARNYSESFSLKALEATRLLLGSVKSGVRVRTVFKTLSQVPKELLFGPSRVPERAMLASAIAFDAFKPLYTRFKPAFASLHLNHVAYMQHRYWRAAEPQRFADALSATDQRFFKTVDERKRYEEHFARWIERAFVYSDNMLAELLTMIDDDTILVLGTGLGVRPFDPYDQIHNPVVRLVHERELFDGIGLERYVVLHQMNPDVTVNFESEDAATRAATLLEGLYVLEGENLFHVARRGSQVFLELNMPRREGGQALAPIRHRTLTAFSADFARHIHEHPTNDQSTAHHKDSGVLIAWSKGHKLTADREVIPVTDVAATVLSWFGIAPQPWMDPSAKSAIQLTT